MQIAIISTALSIVFFLCMYFGFKTGLRIGMEAAKGNPPQPVKNPVIAVQDAIHEAKEHANKLQADKLMMEGLRNILSFTGDTEQE